jgi:hypothetical protein
MDLTRIRILFMAPDTLTLYGIPYDMREGQAPRDLWRAYHEFKEPKPGHYGPKRVKLDWTYLGEPGWFNGSNEDHAEVLAFLAKHRGNVPQNPFEWTTLEP